MRTVDLNALGIEDGDRVLDLGCGRGRHMHAIYWHAVCHAVGIDLGFDDLQETRKGFNDNPDLDPNTPRVYSLAVGDALRLPFPDDTFDKIICSEVLEHIPDYRQALAEIDRLLKPGGKLGVSVPRYWPEWVCWALSEDYHNEPGGHVRIFRSSELRGAIEARGLTFRRRHWAHGLHSPYWWLKCAVGVKREDVRLVKLYHRFLAWDILQQPWLTRMLAKIADPLMGKSVVFYFDKEAKGAA